MISEGESIMSHKSKALQERARKLQAQYETTKI
jgi:hypothetical protein